MHNETQKSCFPIDHDQIMDSIFSFKFSRKLFVLVSSGAVIVLGSSTSTVSSHLSAGVKCCSLPVVVWQLLLFMLHNASFSFSSAVESAWNRDSLTVGCIPINQAGFLLHTVEMGLIQFTRVVNG